MNEIITVFLMLASTTQSTSGNKCKIEYVINLVSIFLNRTFTFSHSTYSFTQQLFTDRADVECLLNAVAFK